MADKGLVQIYTGNGKGKTTAAFGLAVRAAGQNKTVLIYQFLKPPSLRLGERKAINKSGLHIKIRVLEVEWNPTKPLKEQKSLQRAKRVIAEALQKIAAAAEKKSYDVIILDEIVPCIAQKLAGLDDIKNIINRKATGVELVLTGRGADKKLIAMADLVTEMKKIKHPFDKNIKARKGIEF